MINIAEIKELIELIDQSSIDEIELSNESMRIQLKKGSAGEETASSLQALPVTAILETASEQAAVSNGAIDGAEDQTDDSSPQTELPLREIVSNWVGVFKPSVKPGEQVNEGQVVCQCHVESLTLTHDIHSQVCGEIIDILVEDGQLVDYGQPLFIVKADPRRTNDV